MSPLESHRYAAPHYFSQYTAQELEQLFCYHNTWMVEVPLQKLSNAQLTSLLYIYIIIELADMVFFSPFQAHCNDPTNENSQ